MNKAKFENIVLHLAVVFTILAVAGLFFGIHYVWLNYTPCSFHSVKDAPVRCLKEPRHEQ